MLLMLEQRLPVVRAFRSLRFAAVLLAVAPLPAHVISMSSGELRVAGETARYELVMPLYEISHLEDPQPTLLDNFRIYAGGEELRRTKGACEVNTEEGSYVCRSEFSVPPETEALTVECTYSAVTVPNHVHVLRARRGEVTEQAIFDFSFNRREIRFRPATPAQVALSELAAGAVRVITGPAQLLFLLAIVIAGRSRRELLLLAAGFVAAQCLAAVVIESQGWQPPPRFIEAAAALTVAYLAVEILLLPEAQGRWAVAAGMGVFHGLYFGRFLQQADMQALGVLGGVAAAEAALLLLMVFLLGQLKRGLGAQWTVRAFAVALLGVGLLWFFLRLRT